VRSRWQGFGAYTKKILDAPSHLVLSLPDSVVTDLDLTASYCSSLEHLPDPVLALQTAEVPFSLPPTSVTTSVDPPPLVLLFFPKKLLSPDPPPPPSPSRASLVRHLPHRPQNGPFLSPSTVVARSPYLTFFFSHAPPRFFMHPAP